MQITSRLASFRNRQCHKELPSKRQRTKLRERWALPSYKVPAASKQDEYDEFVFVSNVCYVEIDGKEDFRTSILAPIEDMPSREELMQWLDDTAGLGPTEAIALRPRLRSPSVSCVRSVSKRHPARAPARVTFARKLRNAFKNVFQPAAKRQRTKSPERSYESPSGPVQDEMLSWLLANGGTEIPVDAEIAAAFFGAVSGSSATSPVSSISSDRHPSRVRFAPELVTAVVEIPSCLLMTTEEKRCLYRDNRNLEMEIEKGRLERRFDRSRRCHNNASEEIMFFRNHLGELVHPAHFDAYMHDDIPGLSLDAVPGFSSFDDYMNYLDLYTRFHENAVRKKRFRPQKR